MRKNRVFLLSALLFLFSVVAHAADTYELDATHTFVLWRVNHMGYSMQAGKCFASGSLVLDQAKLSNSKVTAVFQLNTLSTGLPDLDKHLLNKLFFDTNQYPTAIFTSNKTIITGKNKAKVSGILTLHGVSKEVTLDVKLNKIGIDIITDQKTVGFSANAQIKRSDFGISALVPQVGDDVKLDIEAEAFLPKQQG